LTGRRAGSRLGVGPPGERLPGHNRKGEAAVKDILQRTWMLWTALAAVLLGYGFLAAGRLSIGPLLLVGGYCVLLPLFLWRSFRRRVGE
jgi:hypothetical protein